jgi:hypothetical protein
VSTQYIEEEGDFHSIGKHQLSHHFKTPLVSILTKEFMIEKWFNRVNKNWKNDVQSENIKGIYRKDGGHVNYLLSVNIIQI